MKALIPLQVMSINQQTTVNHPNPTPSNNFITILHNISPIFQHEDLPDHTLAAGLPHAGLSCCTDRRSQASLHRRICHYSLRACRAPAWYFTRCPIRSHKPSATRPTISSRDRCRQHRQLHRYVTFLSKCLQPDQQLLTDDTLTGANGQNLASIAPALTSQLQLLQTTLNGLQGITATLAKTPLTLTEITGVTTLIARLYNTLSTLVSQITRVTCTYLHCSYASGGLLTSLKRALLPPPPSCPLPSCSVRS